MSNKRDLKKFVRHTCGSIAGECVLAKIFVKGLDSEKIDKALVKVADLQEATLKLISVAYDKAPRDFATPAEYHKARREYFKKSYDKLVHEFEEHLNEIVKLMNEALPAEQREENKKKLAQ